MRGKLEIACGSYNELNPSYNLWHTDSGDDTRFTLFHTVDGAPKGGVEGVEGRSSSTTRQELASIETVAMCGPITAGIRIGLFGMDSAHRPRCDAWVFQLRSWFWNYYYYGKDWYYQRADDPPYRLFHEVGQAACETGGHCKRGAMGRSRARYLPATVPSLQLGVDGPRTGQGMRRVRRCVIHEAPLDSGGA